MSTELGSEDTESPNMGVSDAIPTDGCALTNDNATDWTLLGAPAHVLTFDVPSQRSMSAVTVNTAGTFTSTRRPCDIRISELHRGKHCRVLRPQEAVRSPSADSRPRRPRQRPAGASCRSPTSFGGGARCPRIPPLAPKRTPKCSPARVSEPISPTRLRQGPCV